LVLLYAEISQLGDLATLAILGQAVSLENLPSTEGVAARHSAKSKAHTAKQNTWLLPDLPIQNPKSFHLITLSARASTLGGIFLF